jgi:hypothetical protein
MGMLCWFVAGMDPTDDPIMLISLGARRYEESKPPIDESFELRLPPTLKILDFVDNFCSRFLMGLRFEPKGLVGLGGLFEYSMAGRRSREIVHSRRAIVD